MRVVLSPTCSPSWISQLTRLPFLPPPVDFNIIVLGQGFWPLEKPKTEFTIPTDLQKTYDRFVRYYQSKHSCVILSFSLLSHLMLTCPSSSSISGRKLDWLWHVSKTELRTRYLSTSFIFMTSMYQMAVLVQYNAADAFTYKELQTATSLNDTTLQGVLGLLTKSKVLNLVKEEGEEDSYELNYSGCWLVLEKKGGQS